MQLTRRQAVLSALSMGTLPFSGCGGSDNPIPVETPETFGIASDKLASLNAYLDGQVTSGVLAGVVTQIGRNGHVVQTRAAGLSKIAGNVAMPSDAICRLASATKIITSVAALTLLDQGRFSLDDAISTYLPEWLNPLVLTNPVRNLDLSWNTVPASRAITVRDLMSQTSGLQYAFGGNDLDTAYVAAGIANWTGTLAGFSQTLAGFPLAFQPGSQFYYSFSTDILGRLMEVVTGKQLDEIVFDNVLAPLGMVDTGFDVPHAKASRLPTNYNSAGGVLSAGGDGATALLSSQYLARPLALSAGGGWADEVGGGMVSTASDLGILMQMLLNGGQFNGVRILQSNTVTQMITDQIAAIPPGNRFPPAFGAVPGRGYGLGIGVQTGVSPGKPIVFWGGSPYNTEAFADFETGIFGIMLPQTGPFAGLFNPAGVLRNFRSLALDAAI